MDRPPTLVFRSRRYIDILTAAICLPLALLAVWVVGGPIKASDFAGIRGGLYFLMLFRLFGPAGPASALLLFGFWFGAMGTGAAWRALDRRPLLIADADGLVFHPAFARDKAFWSDVKRVVMAGPAPGCLEFTLTKRVWSISAPLSSPRVRIDRMLMGLSTRETRRLVPQLNRLKRAARDRQRAPIEVGIS
ncbi:hypothetical protein BH10PSE4_BH10PSE4_34690 [soil metagenome]